MRRRDVIREVIALLDFTNCQIDRCAVYGGSDRKFGIVIDGKHYMLKIADRIPDAKRNELNSSYANSAYSEYLGCHILESMGFSVQKTLLGVYTKTSSKGIERTYPAVACENFVQDGQTLVEFKVLENALLDHKAAKIPTLEDLYAVLTSENEYFSEEDGKMALRAYWDLFIGDALLGNFDRHANNWGYLIDSGAPGVTMAPVYDCGSCLYPQLCDDEIERVLNSKEEIQLRIDKFPQAALEDSDGKKISYKEYIGSFRNPDCTAALIRVFPRININRIAEIVDSTEGISELRKKFYKTILLERYNQILKEPYSKLNGMRV